MSALELIFAAGRLLPSSLLAFKEDFAPSLSLVSVIRHVLSLVLLLEML
jgi:hypothetical protein